ncbi:hypothetical protein [Buttiauxella warmboldiae]|nr:hypothetical protein [Buttiauxella warmboldiae]
MERAIYPGYLTIIHHFTGVTNYPVQMDFYALRDILALAEWARLLHI